MTRRAKYGPKKGVRTNAKLTAAQHLEIMDRYDNRGQTAQQIANAMKQPYGRIAGVCYNGNGARTLERVDSAKLQAVR